MNDLKGITYEGIDLEEKIKKDEETEKERSARRLIREAETKYKSSIKRYGLHKYRDRDEKPGPVRYLMKGGKMTKEYTTARLVLETLNEFDHNYRTSKGICDLINTHWRRENPVKERTVHSVLMKLSSLNPFGIISVKKFKNSKNKTENSYRLIKLEDEATAMDLRTVEEEYKRLYREYRISNEVRNYRTGKQKDENQEQPKPTQVQEIAEAKSFKVDLLTKYNLAIRFIKTEREFKIEIGLEEK